MAALPDEHPVTNQQATPLPGRYAGQPRDVSALSGRERASLALAARYGVTAVEALAVVRYAGSRDGNELLSVASRTAAGTRYTVVYDPASDTVESCDCAAHGPCWHIGAARMRVELWHYTFEREEVYREQDDASETAEVRAFERREA